VWRGHDPGLRAHHLAASLQQLPYQLASLYFGHGAHLPGPSQVQQWYPWGAHPGDAWEGVRKTKIY